MTCEQCKDKLTEFIEGDLSSDEKQQLQAHLADCPECARALQEMRGLLAVLHGLPEVEPPAGLRESLRNIATDAVTSAPSWWQRSRYVVATVSAAAAAVLLMWTGMLFYQQESGETAVPMVAEHAAPPSDETGAVLGEQPETDDVSAEDEDAALSEADLSANDSPEPSPATVEEPPPPERSSPRLSAPAPSRVADSGEERDVRPRTVSPSRDTIPQPAPPSPPRIAETPPSMRSGGPSEESTSEAGSHALPAPRMSRSTSPDKTVGMVGAAGEGPTGPAGPAGPAPESVVAEAEEPAGSRATLTMPEPMYLDAGEGAATARVGGEGTPFTVGITPPHEKVTGTVLPATIRLETEADVARARVTVAGSEGLELVGIDEDGVIFEGPLTAGQETVLSVRMFAREAGVQSMTMRLRSTDPIVDTQLDVRMGDFAEPVPPEQRPVQFNFTGTPIREAVSEVTRQSGLSVIVDPGVGDATVTARADDPVPAAGALRAIAESAGLTVSEDGGRFVVEKAGDE